MSTYRIGGMWRVLAAVLGVGIVALVPYSWFQDGSLYRPLELTLVGCLLLYGAISGRSPAWLENLWQSKKSSRKHP